MDRCELSIAQTKAAVVKHISEYSLWHKRISVSGAVEVEVVLKCWPKKLLKWDKNQQRID